MNKIDVILALPLIWGAFIGFKKGLILELASFVGLILGIYGAIKFSDFTAQQLTKYVEVSAEWLGLISFILTFIGIVVSVFLLAKLLDKTLKLVALGFVNRLLGLLFGSLKYLLIVSTLIYFFENLNTKFEFVEKDFDKGSLLYKPIKTTMYPFKEMLSTFEIDKVKEKAEEYTPSL